MVALKLQAQSLSWAPLPLPLLSLSLLTFSLPSRCTVVGGRVGRPGLAVSRNQHFPPSVFFPFLGHAEWFQTLYSQHASVSPFDF